MNVASTRPQLADRPRLRALLRLPRRGDESVVPRPRVRTTTRSTSPISRRGLPLHRGHPDKAIEFISDAKADRPEKPFFLYYAPGACHAPHHAPTEWIAALPRSVRPWATRPCASRRWPPEGGSSRARRTRSSEVNPSDARNSLGPRRPAVPPTRRDVAMDSLSDDEKHLFARMRRSTPDSFARRPSHRPAPRLLEMVEERGNTIRDRGVRQRRKR